VLSKTLETIGGGQFIGDLGAFLREFADVLGEFQRRGGDFEKRLRSADAGVLLVTSASPFSVREAEGFLAQLSDYGLRIDAVVLNRIDPALPEPATQEQLADALAGHELESQAQRVWTAYAGARALGERTWRSIEAIRRSRTELRVWTAPRLSDPPDTIPELEQLGAAIFGD